MRHIIENAGEFKTGDPVPEWLFSIVPIKGSDGVCVMEFQTDVVVLKVFGEFWIIPAETEREPIVVDGTGHASISATETPVVIPVRFLTFGRPGGYTTTIYGDGWKGDK